MRRASPWANAEWVTQGLVLAASSLLCTQLQSQWHTKCQYDWFTFWVLFFLPLPRHSPPSRASHLSVGSLPQSFSLGGSLFHKAPLLDFVNCSVPISLSESGLDFNGDHNSDWHRLSAANFTLWTCKKNGIILILQKGSNRNISLLKLTTFIHPFILFPTWHWIFVYQLISESRCNLCQRERVGQRKSGPK